VRAISDNKLKEAIRKEIIDGGPVKTVDGERVWTMREYEEARKVADRALLHRKCEKCGCAWHLDCAPDDMTIKSCWQCSTDMRLIPPDGYVAPEVRSVEIAKGGNDG